MSLPIDRRKFLTWITTLMALGSRGSGAVTQPDLRRWTCTNQDCVPYVYDPGQGAVNVADVDHPIPPGVAFGDLPENRVCPICGNPKSDFLPLSH